MVKHAKTNTRDRAGRADPHSEWTSMGSVCHAYVRKRARAAGGDLREKSVACCEGALEFPRKARLNTVLAVVQIKLAFGWHPIALQTRARQFVQARVNQTIMIADDRVWTIVLARDELDLA